MEHAWPWIVKDASHQHTPTLGPDCVTRYISWTCPTEQLSPARAGTSTASEVSQPTDDYADLVARLQGMCFGLLEDPLAMPMEGGSTEEEQRTASTGSVSQFESASSAHAFDLDLGPLTSQPRVPHAVSTKPGSNRA